MQTYINPQLSDWSALTSRPTKEAQDLQKIVLDVFEKIQSEKDKALIDFTERFDGVKLTSLEVSKEADVVIIMAGLTESYESEGFDRKHLSIL